MKQPLMVQRGLEEFVFGYVVFCEHRLFLPSFDQTFNRDKAHKERMFGFFVKHIDQALPTPSLPHDGLF